MNIGIFIFALLILIWIIVKVYNSLSDLDTKAVKLEQSLHTTRKKLYKVSNAIEGDTTNRYM